MRTRKLELIAKSIPRLNYPDNLEMLETTSKILGFDVDSSYVYLDSIEIPIDSIYGVSIEEGHFFIFTKGQRLYYINMKNNEHHYIDVNLSFFESLKMRLKLLFNC